MNDEKDNSSTAEMTVDVEHVGIAEDSGFASISGHASTSTASSETGNDVANGKEKPTQLELELDLKRKRQAATENRRLDRKEYNQEAEDKQYKCLMHLLDKSKFYSAYLVQKIDESLKKETMKSGDKRKAKTTDENSPPKKRIIRSKKGKLNNSIKKYISKKDAADKAGTKQLNLSEEETPDELLAKADNEATNVQEISSIQLKYFVGELRDYQIEGLKWLKILYENGLNGILADEMGLGKTIQVIALICHLIEKKIPGPYLIIAPLSTIPNWLMEFENFAPKIPVVLFYGTPDDRNKLYRKISEKSYNIDGYKTQPVVLTTFEIPLMEHYYLKRQLWRYIIIDEGHRIKNHKCLLVQVLKKCKSLNRLLLTGTPLQNNLSELWSLLNFLAPDIFNDLAVFESWFDPKELQNDEGKQRILKQESEKEILSMLREILKPFMLRRVKTDVCLEIPAKKEIIVYAPLTELQHTLYKAVLSRDINTLSKIEPEQLIVPDVNGKRPLRKCRMKTDVSKYLADNMGNMSSSRASTPIDDEREMSNMSSLCAWTPVKQEDDVSTWKKNVEAEKNSLSTWKQYADITERNKEFFVRIQFRHRLTMYKKIVNHPYLVHCPLDNVGLPRIDEELLTSSGKLMVLDAMFKKLHARGHKILLFSTMTMILDMLEDYLEMKRDYLYVRLDGKTQIEERKENIKAFNSNPDIFLFLISTRAGGVGLNLTGADTVIIYDSDWNPQVDIQAMARCHRIGQTRPVVVYKLCTKGTIDETIITRGIAKRKLEQMVISTEGLALNNIDTLVRLKDLLESNENHVVGKDNEVYTDQELDEILDRSDLMPSTLPAIKKKPKKTSANTSKSRAGKMKEI